MFGISNKIWILLSLTYFEAGNTYKIVLNQTGDADSPLMLETK